MYLKGLNILYAPVPKCACTSLKDFCVGVEYGKPFEDTELATKDRNLHGVFRAVRFARLKKNKGLKRLGSLLSSAIRWIELSPATSKKSLMALLRSNGCLKTN